MSKDRPSSASADRKKKPHSVLKTLIVGNRRKSKHGRPKEKAAHPPDASTVLSTATNLLPIHHSSSDALSKPNAVVESTDTMTKSSDNHRSKQRRVHPAKSSRAPAVEATRHNEEMTEKAQRRLSHCDETSTTQSSIHPGTKSVNGDLFGNAECQGTCNPSRRRQQEIERLRECVTQLQHDLQSEQDSKTTLQQQMAALQDQVQREEQNKTNRVKAKMKDMDTIHQQNLEINQLVETIRQLQQQQQAHTELLDQKDETIQKLQKQTKTDEESIQNLQQAIDRLTNQQNHDKKTFQKLQQQRDQHVQRHQRDRNLCRDLLRLTQQLEDRCDALEQRRQEILPLAVQLSSWQHKLDDTLDRQAFHPLPTIEHTSSSLEAILLQNESLTHGDNDDDCEENDNYEDDDNLGSGDNAVTGIESSSSTAITDRLRDDHRSIINKALCVGHLEHDSSSKRTNIDTALASREAEPAKHDHFEEDDQGPLHKAPSNSVPDHTSSDSEDNKALTKVPIFDEKPAAVLPKNEGTEATAAEAAASPDTVMASSPEPKCTESLETEKLPEAEAPNKTSSKPVTSHDTVDVNSRNDNQEPQDVPDNISGTMQDDGGDSDETQLTIPVDAIGRKDCDPREKPCEESLLDNAEIRIDENEQEGSEIYQSPMETDTRSSTYVDLDKKRPEDICDQGYAEATEADKQSYNAGMARQESAIVTKESDEVATKESDNQLKADDTTSLPTPGSAMSAQDDSVLWDDEDDLESKATRSSRQTTLADWQKTKPASPDDSKPASLENSKQSNESGWITTKKPAAKPIAPTKKQSSLANFVTPKDKNKTTGRSKKKQPSGNTSFSTSFAKSAAKKRKHSGAPAITKEEKRSRSPISTNFDEIITDSQDAFNILPNRVSLSASKKAATSTSFETPNVKKQILDSTRNKGRDESSVASHDEAQTKKKSRGESLGPGFEKVEEPIKTSSIQEMKSAISNATAGKDNEDYLRESHAHPELLSDNKASESSRHLEIKEVVVCHGYTQTQLTSSGNVDEVLKSPAANYLKLDSGIDMSQGSETQCDTPSAFTDKAHIDATRVIEKKLSEQRTPTSAAHSTQLVKLDFNAKDEHNDKLATHTKTHATPLSEGSETQREKAQSAVNSLELNSETQKSEVPLSQGSETQWEKTETFAEEADKHILSTLAQPAHRQGQSQVRFCLPVETHLEESTKARSNMDADTQGSDTQYDGTALLHAGCEEDTMDASGSTARSHFAEPTRKTKETKATAKNAKTKKALYSGPWISNTHDRNFVDEIDDGRRRRSGKESNNNFDVDFMEQAPETRKTNYARPAYVEPRRRKTSCNDCRSCIKCRDYYRVLEQQGIDTDDPAFKQQNAVKNSRHTIYTPGISSQETPAQFWELSFIDSQQRRQEEALKTLDEERNDHKVNNNNYDLMEEEEAAATTAMETPQNDDAMMEDPLETYTQI